MKGKDCGYGMLNWRPQYSLYKKLAVPEIQDINVLSQFRQQGVATEIIRKCEMISRHAGCSHVGISVGLYKDFGPAQRLYVKLGYKPDGNGVTYDRQAVTAGEVRPIDDGLCLMMIKEL